MDREQISRPPEQTPHIDTEEEIALRAAQNKLEANAGVIMDAVTGDFTKDTSIKYQNSMIDLKQSLSGMDVKGFTPEMLPVLQTTLEKRLADTTTENTEDYQMYSKALNATKRANDSYKSLTSNAKDIFKDIPSMVANDATAMMVRGETPEKVSAFIKGIAFEKDKAISDMYDVYVQNNTGMETLARAVTTAGGAIFGRPIVGYYAGDSLSRFLFEQTLTKEESETGLGAYSAAKDRVKKIDKQDGILDGIAEGFIQASSLFTDSEYATSEQERERTSSVGWEIAGTLGGTILPFLGIGKMRAVGGGIVSAKVLTPVGAAIKKIPGITTSPNAVRFLGKASSFIVDHSPGWVMDMTFMSGFESYNRSTNSEYTNKVPFLEAMKHAGVTYTSLFSASAIASLMGYGLASMIKSSWMGKQTLTARTLNAATKFARPVAGATAGATEFGVKKAVDAIQDNDEENPMVAEMEAASLASMLVSPEFIFTAGVGTLLYGRSMNLGISNRLIKNFKGTSKELSTVKEALATAPKAGLFESKTKAIFRRAKTMEEAALSKIEGRAVAEVQAIINKGGKVTDAEIEAISQKAGKFYSEGEMFFTKGGQTSKAQGFAGAHQSIKEGVKVADDSVMSPELRKKILEKVTNIREEAAWREMFESRVSELVADGSISAKLAAQMVQVDSVQLNMPLNNLYKDMSQYPDLFSMFQRNKVDPIVVDMVLSGEGVLNKSTKSSKNLNTKIQDALGR